MAGYGPDTVGRAIAKDAHNSADELHARKGWHHPGGAWNYQWDQFFENGKKYAKDPNNPDIGRWFYNHQDPEGSLMGFLAELRNITANGTISSDVKWPFPQKP